MWYMEDLKENLLCILRQGLGTWILLSFCFRQELMSIKKVFLPQLPVISQSDWSMQVVNESADARADANIMQCKL